MRSLGDQIASSTAIEQLAIETIALTLIDTPQVAAATEQVRYMWRAAVGRDPDEQAWSRFEDFIVEYRFNAALKVANGDPNRPRILSAIYGPPHHWFGVDVPGSRLAGDNPDNHYSVIPIDGVSRFELTGELSDTPAADFNLTISGNTGLSKTMTSIAGPALIAGEDGRFTVTIGPDTGGANHLTTRPGAMFLFIRESLSDWRQRPATLRIRRLDPPSAPAPDFETMAGRVAEIMIDDVPGAYWWMRLSHAQEPNEMSRPFGTGAVGGLVSQQVSFGHLYLAPDQSFVIRVGDGGAAFRNLVLHDYWYVSMAVDRRTSSLNTSQAVPDDDGHYTYVVSHDDPGIHNWLDPAGQTDMLLVHRWQRLPPSGPAPAIEARRIDRTALAGALPPGVRRIDKAGRRRQLDERRRQFDSRFAEI